MNSSLYRNGPGNLHYENEDRVVFYKITKDKEEWIPLPEKLIMRAKTETEKIQKTESSESFANNRPDEIEECAMCHQTEDCGIYLTRQMAKEQQEAGEPPEIVPGLNPRKRKAKTQSCEGSGLRCKVAKQQTQIRDKDILSIGVPITDKAFDKERILIAESQMTDINRNQEVNLFDPKRIYKMGTSPLEQKLYARVLNKRNRIKGGLHHLTYIIKARCRMKKIDMTMGEAKKEAWRMMLITSQSNTPPRASKTTKTETIQGVLVAMFRISDANMMALFGSAVLPILNPKDDLAQKLMRQSHTVKRHDYHPIHRTMDSARTALSTGTPATPIATGVMKQT
jgi:hypothetical protein